MAERIGSDIAGYRIQALLARGGMGEVYLAKQAFPERSVALKLLPHGLAADLAFRERFIRESNAAASVEHPSIVPVYGAGESDGELWIAMRYIDGEDLRSLLDREGPLSPERTAQICSQMADALQEAHEHGLVHRDVKPANILIGKGDQAYLSDFGLIRHSKFDSDLTKTGQFMGTVDYVAPEQIKGESVDGRADVYSLGCVLYECLAGEPPFRRDTEVATLYAHLEEPRPRLSVRRPELPADFDKIVTTAIAKEPGERFPHASDFAGAIRATLAAGVVSQPPAISGAPGLPTDGSELQRAGAFFVGRERQLSELSAGLDDAEHGRGRLFLLAGEPGIGKTRLADEFSASARDHGALVLWGRCWEAGGAPTFWPWVQAIRTYLREVEPAVVREQMGAGAAEIAQMIPDVRTLFPDLPEPMATDPEGARFRLFDLTATFLRHAADAHPLVLVLDDLQSADTPSLLLLQFLVTVLHDARILGLGTYRDTDLIPDSPLSAAITELRRDPAVRLMALKGFDESDVTKFIDRTTGTSPSASLVAALHAGTEGNPLFVEEVVQLLEEEGRLSDFARDARLSIPPSVREVIGQRLGHLSGGCKEALTLASVLGREFEIEALGRLAGQPSRELVDIVDEAVGARAVTEIAGTTGRLRFAHALFRDSLYDAIPAGSRRSLHRRVGEVLEDMYGIEREQHLVELAHHFFLAIPEAEAERAVEYAHRAAEVAIDRLAFEEAARLYGTALDALKLAREPHDDLRCELLLGEGDAQARAGDMEAAKETFLTAADLARALGRPEKLSRAALGYGGRFVWGRAGNDRRFIPLLEHALGATGERSSVERVRLMARLAGALRSSPDREQSATLSQQALEMARELGDPTTLAYALDGRCGAIWWPENPEERLKLADEMLGLAKAAGDLEDSFAGSLWRATCLAELGEIVRFASELDVMAVLADELRQPSQRLFVMQFSGTLAMMRGQFRQANELAAQQVEMTTNSPHLFEYGEMVIASHRYRLFKEAGRFGDAVEILRPVAESITWYPFLRCALADALLELGDEPGARAVYGELAADRFSALPRDCEWLFALSLITPVCAAFGDVERAEILYEYQVPYAARPAFAVHDGEAGAVSRALGILAAVLRRLDDAERHFRDALAMNHRMGALPWIAYTQHEYAKMLLARDAQGDHHSAIELLHEAQRECGELEMVNLAGKVADLLRSVGDPSE